jgi:hypothetical protein
MPTSVDVVIVFWWPPRMYLIDLPRGTWLEGKLLCYKLNSLCMSVEACDGRSHSGLCRDYGLEVCGSVDSTRLLLIML